MGRLKRILRGVSLPVGSRPETSGAAPSPIITNQGSNTNSVHGPVQTIHNHNTNVNYFTIADRPRELDDDQVKITAALEGRHVPNAVYDAQRSTGCMNGTRVQVLRDIETWISDPEAPRIYWLTGMAGTGKTAIGWTICLRASEQPGVILGGSFFCSRSTGLVGQRDIRCVIPTLAQLLARQSITFAQALAAELAHDPDVLHKQIGAQVKQLLHNPLLALRDSPVPILFVIDALDECGGQLITDTTSDAESHRIVSEMLEALVSLSHAEIKLPVKFFVISRPETHIRDTPVSSSEFSQVLRLHAVSEQQITDDIRLYISTRLSSGPRLRESFTEIEVDMLARLCDGLFIVATTALGYILADGMDVAAVRFETLLNVTRDGLSTGAALPLDEMYALILDDATTANELQTISLPDLLRLLASLLSARMTLSIAALADLLELPVTRVRASMSRLHAVIDVPDNDGEPGLRALHASFGDYLVGRAPDRVRIPKALGDDVLAHGCFHVMAKRLRFNVSQSLSSYKPNSPRKPANIALSLEYACCQWIYHVSRLPDASVLDTQIDEIFRPRFLFWLEVMSVLGQVWRAMTILFFGGATVQTNGLSQFLRDAHAFVASSHEAIKTSAPHIYISALPFADKGSLIYKTFIPLCTGLITADVFGIRAHGERLVMTLTGHEGRVTSVSYSPDGRLIASGSSDGTVRIWDTRTGEEAMYPLQSGDGPVWSVAFAPDGKSLASANGARVVCVWSLMAGQKIRLRLLGHSDAILSVAFSSDGRLLAAASADTTASLWKVRTGRLIAILRGHTGEVNAIAFSPDGKFLSSGSDDCTMRFWRCTTGKLLKAPFKGIRSSLYSLCFSPTGGRMASGSGDEGLELWHTPTMRRIKTLQGHMNSIRSVRFSPDGKSLVSAADDQSVRLWDLSEAAGEPPSVGINGHTARVNSAAFSPDGLYIASASDDHTIRIWRSGTRKPAVQVPTGHRHWVIAVATTPDGAFVVSGSKDNSVRVWNARTGEPRFGPLIGHGDVVYSVAVSPDGRFIASASGDRSARLWDAQTGKPVGDPMWVHRDVVHVVAFSADAQWLATGSGDHTVLVLDVATRRPLTLRPLRCSDAVFSVAFSPYGDLVVAGDGAGYIHLWLVTTGEPACLPFQANSEPVNSIAISPDSEHIVSGGQDKMARIWDIGTGDVVCTLRGHNGWVVSVIYSPDGQLVASGSEDGTIRFWDASNGHPILTLTGHQGWVPSISFSADGWSIVSGSVDKTIRIWDLNMARLLLSQNNNHPDSVLVSATLSDGWLTGSSGELLMWVPAEYRPYFPLPPCRLLIDPSGVCISLDTQVSHHGTNRMSCWRKGGQKTEVHSM